MILNIYLTLVMCTMLWAMFTAPGVRNTRDSTTGFATAFAIGLLWPVLLTMALTIFIGIWIADGFSAACRDIRDIFTE